MKVLSFIFSTIFSVLLLTSCGSSVESQHNAWESNKKTVEQYATKYPLLATLIKDQYATAEASMASALEIGDEKERISAMQKANALSTEGVISEVKKIERSTGALKQKITDIKDDFTSEEFSQKTAFLLEEAKESLEKANALLNSNNSSVDNILLALQNEATHLEEVYSSLDKHYDEIVDNRPDDTKPQSEEDSSETKVSDNEQEQKSVATLNCKKCGSALAEGAIKCNQCGAPVKK